MPLFSNFLLLFYEHVDKLCENSRSIESRDAKL